MDQYRKSFCRHERFRCCYCLSAALAKRDWGHCASRIRNELMMMTTIKIEEGYFLLFEKDAVF